MSDEAERLRSRLQAVTAGWERLAAEKDVELAELKKRVVYAETELERERVTWKGWRVQFMELKAENERLRDELTHVRAALALIGLPWAESPT